MPRGARSFSVRDGEILGRPVEMEAADPISIDWGKPKIKYTAEVRDAVVNCRAGILEIPGGDEVQKTKIIRQLVDAAMCVVGCNPRSFPKTVDAAIHKVDTTRVLDAKTFGSWGGVKQLNIIINEIKSLCTDWPLDFALNAPLSLAILVLFLRNVPNKRSGAARFIWEHKIWNKLPTAIQKWEQEMKFVYFAMVCPPYASAYPEGTSMKMYDDLVLAKSGKSSTEQPPTFTECNRESSEVGDRSLSVGDEQSQVATDAQSQLTIPSPVTERSSQAVAHTVDAQSQPTLPSPVHEKTSQVVEHTIEPRTAIHDASAMPTPPAEIESFDEVLASSNKTLASPSLTRSVMSPIENTKNRVADLVKESKNVPRDQHDQFASRLSAQLNETTMPLLSMQDRMSIYVWISDNKPDLPLYPLLKRFLFGTEAGSSQYKAIQQTPSNTPPAKVAKPDHVAPGSQVQEPYRLSPPAASNDHADEASVEGATTNPADEPSLKRSRPSSPSEQSLAKIPRHDGRLPSSAALPTLSRTEQKSVGNDETGSGHMNATARVAARKSAMINMALDGMVDDPSKKRVQVIQKHFQFFTKRLCGSNDSRGYVQRHREELKMELAEALSGSEAGD
ncbi:hypothetical protein CDD80_3502 [Ophiocordyceps camponoti-rufipedis]|uniref:Uncharacterized protein n=1 Tax=Ophiocordyceps camponoti-rufipedis TaxID=2004952 RepID=A0A2C5Z227_9HYPO|nr:hypothetical protein CDD80_3502 [Ophiocordyceps camponoti-rufipedis]